MGTGAIYMWSIFNKPLMAQFGYTTSEVSLVYSLFMLASLAGSILAGWLQNRLPSRIIVLGAGVLFGLGWFGSGFADSIGLLYLLFSGCAGLGNGALYNTIVAVVMKWFPDRRGFANGVCIGAIGMTTAIALTVGGVLALGAYGFVATFQPDAHFGRILAAYGGIFVAGSILWGMVADGYRPDRWDITGALVCLAGMAVIMYAPRNG